CAARTRATASETRCGESTSTLRISDPSAGRWTSIRCAPAASAAPSAALARSLVAVGSIAANLPYRSVSCEGESGPGRVGLVSNRCASLGGRGGYRVVVLRRLSAPLARGALLIAVAVVLAACGEKPEPELSGPAVPMQPRGSG